MAEISVETTINASKETVWNQLTDMNNFSQLSKHIEDASGKVEKGGRLKARLNIRGVHVPLTVWVHDAEENHKFSWGGPTGKLVSTLLDANHYFVIEELGPNQCKLIHGERIDGLLSLGSSVILNRLKPIYSDINEELKRRCEQVAA